MTGFLSFHGINYHSAYSSLLYTLEVQKIKPCHKISD